MTMADCAATGDPDPKLIANPLLIRKDPAVREARRILAKAIGAPASRVIPFINYMSHSSLSVWNDQLNILTLEIILKALDAVDDRVQRIKEIRQLTAPRKARPSTAKTASSHRRREAENICALTVDYYRQKPNFMDAEQPIAVEPAEAAPPLKRGSSQQRLPIPVSRKVSVHVASDIDGNYMELFFSMLGSQLQSLGVELKPTASVLDTRPITVDVVIVLVGYADTRLPESIMHHGLLRKLRQMTRM